MSHNTFGHLFRVTTFGESHGPAIGCVVDGCPPGIPLTDADIQAYLDKRRPGQSRFTTQRQEPDQVKILSGVFEDERTRRPGHHRHADHAADRERRPALEGLCRDPRQVPPRPRRLHLSGEIRHPRLSRRRPLLGARDRGARGRRRRRAQDHPGRHHPRRAGADGPAQDRPRQLGLGGGRPQSVLLPRRQGREVLRGLSRRRPQGRLLHRRGDRGGRRGVPAGWGAPIYGKLDQDLAAAHDVHQRGEGRRDRRRLRRRRLLRRGERRRDAHAPTASRSSCPTTPAASWAASPPARPSWRASR